jgi:hypothetical protein
MIFAPIVMRSTIQPIPVGIGKTLPGLRQMECKAIEEIAKALKTDATGIPTHLNREFGIDDVLRLECKRWDTGILHDWRSANKSPDLGIHGTVICESGEREKA